MSMQLGQYNQLELVRKTINGFYLSDGTEEILLPSRYVTEDMKNGDMLEVFVYKDSEDRLVATTDQPKATVGEYAVLEVVSNTGYGSFLDWGLSKDILLPKSNQVGPSEVGDKKFVLVYEDMITNRLVTTEKFAANNPEELYLKPSENVEIIPYRQTPLGYEVLINETYFGLLHEGDVWMPIELYKMYPGHIKFIRDDFKIDIALGERGFSKTEKTEKQIMEKLRAHDGYLPYNDKSSAEDITAFFQMSKKTFKMTIGTLYRKKLLRIDVDGIHAV